MTGASFGEPDEADFSIAGPQKEDAMKWCRLRTESGPSFGIVEGDLIEIVNGTPFEKYERTSRRMEVHEAKLLPPVIPGTFYAIGSNYRGHVLKMAEAHGRSPIFYDRPRVGYRANSALIGHDDDIIKPPDASDQFQYEAELVAVIGKRARHVSPEEASECIFGWTIGNDVSERIWQQADPTNIRAKNADTFKPMGPWIAQDADLPSMRTRVTLNGRLVHDFATADMLFDAPTVISEISRYNTLGPGDVVWLGTDDRPLNLKPGDLLEIEISGIGLLRNRVIAG
jgi:2-keto-4-pentenoate hydratase/2-oxohepta-3-ene-1,7-dioic acid hydratase in catechol pathway